MLRFSQALVFVNFYKFFKLMKKDCHNYDFRNCVSWPFPLRKHTQVFLPLASIDYAGTFIRQQVPTRLCSSPRRPLAWAGW